MAVEVNVEAQGSELDTVALSSATVLSVADGSGYDAPGTVEVNGVRRKFISSDVEAGTVTLISSLGVAADIGDRVLVVTGDEIAYDYTLVVALSEGDTVEVPIPYEARGAWSPGPLLPPIPVTVSDDLTQILDAPGRSPQVGTEVTIQAGGLYTFTDATGNKLCQIGVLPDGGFGFKTYRPDGSVMLESVGSGYLGLTYTAIRDQLGNALFFDDPVANGISRPRLSLGQWVDYTPLGTAAVPTTSATFVTLQALFAYEQQPAARFDLMVSSPDAATTGEVRVLDPNGVAVGSPLTVPPNANTVVHLGPTILTGWPSYDLAGYFTLQARRTGGTGAIGARGLGAWGVAAGDTV
jgi:hypothetical protein